MKTYVLIISRTFPKTHMRNGDRTYFAIKIMLALNQQNSEIIEEYGADLIPKLHTIRGNYDFWAKRIKNVQEGKAILSLRYWSGKPYNSKQIEVCQLDKDSGVGVQELSMVNGLPFPIIDGVERGYVTDIPQNDGLSPEDFKEWFKKYDRLEPMAIIHFTKFRY